MIRPTGSGPLSALLVLAPLVALPILAVVGIPQFAGGNSIDSQISASKAGSRAGNRAVESRAGTSADADDLFAPLDRNELAGDDAGFDDPLRSPNRRSRSRRTADELDDGFGGSRSDRAESGFETDEDAGDSIGSRGRRSRNRTGSDAVADTEESELDDEFGEEVRPLKGSRTRSRASRDEIDAAADTDLELQPDENDPSVAKGTQYADASGDFSDSPRKSGSSTKRPRAKPTDEFAMEETDPAADFESAPRNSQTQSRTQATPRSAAPRTRPRDPNDAPPFLPAGGSEERAPVETQQPSPGARRPSNSLAKAATEVADSTLDSKRPSANPAASGTSQQEMTLKTMFDRLQTYGMTPESHYFTYLEDSESFLFTCTATRPGSSATPQKFEEEAADPMLAVLKVLKRMQIWQAKKPKTTRSISE